ncbi:PAS domain-containing protein [Celeribacter litoreus]|uniref:PAS domain-containing protein n=1 Tax=Celeribacter litoreus TaxID=2876714 RepID=UPI001CC9DD76|nr:PAS domain-containing protein [Celeribacter litoreus]MCA0043815.1 PAS domain-containing protein [Celeribacter litoreus]
MTKVEFSNGNVVPFLQRRTETHFAALKTVEGYWNGLRQGRSIPLRSDIDPRGIQDALEYAFILERIAPGVARFRLAGMHLTDLMGMEVRGMPLTAMFVPEARATVSTALEAVFDTPECTTLTLEAERGIGRGEMSGALLLCPLKSDLGDVNRVLGALQTNGPIGRQPRRFKIGGAQMNSETRAERGQEFAEAKRKYEGKISKAPRPRGGTEKPRLRLVKSDM